MPRRVVRALREQRREHWDGYDMTTLIQNDWEAPERPSTTAEQGGRRPPVPQHGSPSLRGPLVAIDLVAAASAWLAGTALFASEPAVRPGEGPVVALAVLGLALTIMVNAGSGLYANPAPAVWAVEATTVLRASLLAGALTLAAAQLLGLGRPLGAVATSCLAGAVLVGWARRGFWRWMELRRPFGPVPEPVPPFGYGRATSHRDTLKRAVDLAIAPLIVAMALPIIAVTALVVLVTDGRPVFFRQRRVGRNGVPFTIYKFRTMQRNAERHIIDLRELNEREGPLFKVEDDPRVTRTGRLLRETSIDELPQLFNVLNGTMSLVGPRPALVEETVRFGEDLLRRHEVRPGITGLWQVSARDDPSFESYRCLDLTYIEKWSVLMDVVILFATVPAVICRAWRVLVRRAFGDGGMTTRVRRLGLGLARRPVLVPAAVPAVTTAVPVPAPAASPVGSCDVILSSGGDLVLDLTDR